MSNVWVDCNETSWCWSIVSCFTRKIWMHMLHHGLITVGPLETNELVMRNNNTISGNNMQGFINHPFIRPGKLLIRVVSSVFYLSSSTQTHVPLPVRRWNDAVACETKPMSQPQRHIEGMFKKAVSFFLKCLHSWSDTEKIEIHLNISWVIQDGYFSFMLIYLCFVLCKTDDLSPRPYSISHQ